MLSLVRRLALVTLATSFSVAAIAFWRSSSSAPEDADAPINGGLVVNDHDLDFGEVWLQNDFQWSFPIYNPTDHPVSVAQFTTSCSCAKGKQHSITIPARGSERATFKIDLSPRTADESLLDVRQYQALVTPNIGGVSNTVGWCIHGVVKPLIKCNPRTIDFGEYSLFKQRFEAQSVLVRCLPPATSVRASCDSPHLRIDTSPARGGSEYKLTAAPTNDLPRGAFSFRIRLAPSSSDGHELPSSDLFATATIVDDVYLSPQKLLLRVDESAEETFEILSHSGAALETVKFEPEDPTVLSVQRDPSKPQGNRFRVIAGIRESPIRKQVRFLRIRVTVCETGSDTPADLYLSVTIDARNR